MFSAVAFIESIDLVGISSIRLGVWEVFVAVEILFQQRDVARGLVVALVVDLLGQIVKS